MNRSILSVVLGMLLGFMLGAASTTTAEDASSSCDFNANIGLAHLDFYWDESTNSFVIARPEILLAVHVRGQVSRFDHLYYADEMEAQDLECHVGGEAQYWTKSYEGSRAIWGYNSPADRPGHFNVKVGRLQVSTNEEVTAEYGHEYVTSSATWRPISRDDTSIPLRPAPPPPTDAPVSNCFTDVKKIESEVGGNAKYWSQISDKEWLYDATTDMVYASLHIPERYEIDHPGGKSYGPTTVNTVIGTLRCNR